MKPRLLILLMVVMGSFVGLTAWQWVNDARGQGPPAAITATTMALSPPSAEGAAPAGPAERAGRVAYVVSRPGTRLTTSGEDTATPIAGGLLLPVLGEVDGGYRVFDTCNREGSVDAAEVEAGLVPAMKGGGFDEAVFVIDPGHGLPDYGAVGPSGLAETEVNLDVGRRVVELLRSARDVDWATGAVTTGSQMPPAAAALLTRDPEGPEGGEYQVGLTYRATVANALEATALVSIHHNTSPETTLDHPGSEAFVSLTDPRSPRLGGLMVEELRAGFSRFEANWTGSTGNGLISRINAEGKDYYTILDRTAVPAVIVEGVYISNPSEEALALTDEFRQAYAEAVYRALVRFVTTDDHPLPAPEPDLWEVDRPGPSMSDCRVPSP